MSSSPPIWFEGYDTTYNRHYYFNTVTSESSWEKPLKYKPYEGSDSDSESSANSDNSDTNDESSDEEEETSISLSPVKRRSLDVSQDVSAQNTTLNSKLNSTLGSLSKSSLSPKGNSLEELLKEQERMTSLWEDNMRKLSLAQSSSKSSTNTSANPIPHPNPKLLPSPSKKPTRRRTSTTKKPKPPGNPKAWNQGNHGPPPPRPGLERHDQKSQHAAEAHAVHLHFSEHIRGDFISRQDLDVRNRKREIERLSKREMDEIKKEQKEAIKLNQKSKQILKETGLMDVDKDVWFDRLHKSRVNKMAQFLMGQREVDLQGNPMNHHIPTFFTDKGRTEEKNVDVLNQRSRTNAAALVLNPRRFGYLNQNPDAIKNAIAEDLLLSPQNKTGKNGMFFKSNAVGDSGLGIHIDDNSAFGPLAEERDIFLSAFKKNLEIDQIRTRKEEEVRMKKTKDNRRSSCIGIVGDGMGVVSFKGAKEADEFIDRGIEEAKEHSNEGMVLALSPPKGRMNRRTSTSELLVKGIVKQVEKMYRGVGGWSEEELEDKKLNRKAFKVLMEQMAFMGAVSGEEMSDGVLVGRAFNLYAHETSEVGLDGCIRLLLQVLAGLEVKGSVGGESEDWLEEEREVVTEIGARYGERRLSAVPGWWNNKEGNLTKTTQSRPPSPSKELTYNELKPVKGAHRRMSTLTSKVRKTNHIGSKKVLEEYYKCTFKPEINKLSRKMDAKEKGTPGKKKMPRTEAWKKWEIRRKKKVENSRIVLAKKEIVGCTFKPELNKKTQKMAQKGRAGVRRTSVDQRLYEEGLKKEMDKRQKHITKERINNLQQKEWEERELREFCTFKPEVGGIKSQGSTDVKTVGDVGGVKEWLEFKTKANKAKVERMKVEKQLKLRASGGGVMEPTIGLLEGQELIDPEEEEEEEIIFQPENKNRSSVASPPPGYDSHTKDTREDAPPGYDDHHTDDLPPGYSDQHTPGWEPGTKFCEPFTFNKSGPGWEARKGKRQEVAAAQKREEEQKKDKLRKEALKTAKIAKEEEWWRRRLFGVGDGTAAAFIIELEAAGGGLDRLAVYRGEDLGLLVTEYGDMRGLTDDGRGELFAALEENMELVMEEDEQERYEFEQDMEQDVLEGDEGEAMEDGTDLLVEDL
ncbi:hypothetical protein TrLO_g9384 [Triparma laevis f. longispina]|uniref:WW domain-containing protein n=1 Tax=Triparma laevis f. longispina TaxID=1714387 RepID=A0A9W7FSF5_9STRA|nr:hypothetical protein TrLO_g9384 [Triparma laevis f. longispina]